MKILLLNFTDSGGGAAIAAARLFRKLRENNIDATLGVVEKTTNEENIVSLKKRYFYEKFKIFRFFRKFLIKSMLFLRKAFNTGFRTTNSILHSANRKTLIDINYINNSNFDLIHLHWVNGDMISIEDIAKIKKPIVWTMHDCWVFCGAEHYPNILESDNRFIEGYTQKNRPKSIKGPDICRKTWLRKRKAWKKCRFNFISPSNFEKEAFEKSALFRNFVLECTVIRNIVQENIFMPINKKILKEMYHIPLAKKVIGFGTAYSINDKKNIKGSFLLLEALQKIKEIDYYLVTFGNADSSFINIVNLPVFETGFQNNPYILATIYNLCDVFVCPSLLENLPNVCLESLFCGVPVAAFNTGGIPDIVEHKKTGYLANCFDTDDLYQGILYCVDNYDELSKNSLIKAKLEFGNETIVKKHIELYKSVLTGTNK
ncbi:glycosyltransferase [Breznakiellaceae bacterium SP9]